MDYKEFIVETFEGVLHYIQINYEDGSFKSFPVDENNPEYIAFLAQLEAEESN
jgi:hypothetical protein